MDSLAIKPNLCYRLITGQIVRAKSIDSLALMVLCDMLDAESKTWIEMFNFIPASMFKEPCADPSR